MGKFLIMESISLIRTYDRSGFPFLFVSVRSLAVFKGVCPSPRSGPVYWLRVVPTAFSLSLYVTTQSPLHSDTGNSSLLSFFSVSPAWSPVLLPTFLRTSFGLCCFSLSCACAFPFIDFSSIISFLLLFGGLACCCFPPFVSCGFLWTLTVALSECLLSQTLCEVLYVEDSHPTMTQAF